MCLGLCVLYLLFFLNLVLTQKLHVFSWSLPRPANTVVHSAKILITILVVCVGAFIHLHDSKLNQCFWQHTQCMMMYPQLLVKKPFFKDSKRSATRVSKPPEVSSSQLSHDDP